LAQHDTTDGAHLYNSACAACHGVNGEGAPDGHFPALTKTSAARAKNPSDLVMSIVNGVSRTGSNGYIAMPAFKTEMTNAQVASVATYVGQTFGGTGNTVTAAQVAEMRAGGPTPWIVANAAWMTWLAIVIAVIVVLAIIAVFVMRGRRRSTV
ncbi:cytochrome c, partial [Thioclava sp. BHET1]